MTQETSADMNTQPSSSGKIQPTRQVHRLRILLVVMLITLTIQGWFGDTVNIFVAPPGTSTTVPFSSLIQTISSYGFLLIWHAFEGLFLVILALVLIGASFKWSKKRSVRITSILGAFMVISAAIGGLSFVLSGFNAGGSSAQMGGSFIGAYAFYFMELYYTK